MAVVNLCEGVHGEGIKPMCPRPVASYSFCLIFLQFGINDFIFLPFWITDLISSPFGINDFVSRSTNRSVLSTSFCAKVAGAVAPANTIL